jgi:folate-binding protein YgfZ
MANRNEGTPAYLAAHSASAVYHHRDRGFLSIEGAAPGDMLKGILSGRIPAPLGEAGDGVLMGEAPYSTILTPKGKMVTDLSVLPDPTGGFLLELPELGREGALAHFRKFLHPRFAQVEDRSSAWSQLTLMGPKAGEILKAVLEVEGDLPDPDHLRYHKTLQSPGFWMVGNGDLGLPAVDIILPSSEAEGLHASFIGSGALSLDEISWEVLRIEAGTPRFGMEMTEDTIPLEAGIQTRAIDYEKGCYTGQEVIVRIRDRGQVNKTLRRIFLGDSVVPTKGEELFGVDNQKVVGWVTSACISPHFGEVLALGMVKRVVGVGDEVRLGGPKGSTGRVAELG